MDDLTLQEKRTIVEVMKRIRLLRWDLEELGVDVTVVAKDTPPDTPRGVVLHLTAVIREDIEEGPG